jgi:hypothetical protein
MASEPDKGEAVPAPALEADTDKHTPVYASSEWLSGYGEGEKRGVASFLGALREALGEVGVTGNDADVIMDKICQRANVIRG